MAERAPNIAELFDPETHYNFTGKVFDQIVRNEVLERSIKAQEALQKKYGGGVLSSTDNITFVSLLETWLATDLNIDLIAAKDEVTLETDDFGLALPISPTGLRWVTDAFVAGCHGEAGFREVEDPDSPIAVYTYEGDLFNGDHIYIAADYIPASPEAKPVTPTLVSITRG